MLLEVLPIGQDVDIDARFGRNLPVGQYRERESSADVLAIDP
jgi:hypothetical protein